MLPDRFETARLVLRPIARADAPAIFAGYAADPAVTRYLVWPPHAGLADTEAHIERCLAAEPAALRSYVLAGRDDGQVRGAFDLRRPARHRIEFGYVLARQWWGRGLMTEALAAVAGWALAQPDIWRIGAVCDVENIGSARVMEKAGLAREGILRRWLVHPALGPEPRDCYGYARVR